MTDMKKILTVDYWRSKASTEPNRKAGKNGKIKLVSFPIFPTFLFNCLESVFIRVIRG